jgi:hypothetical protein
MNGAIVKASKILIDRCHGDFFLVKATAQKIISFLGFF